MYTILFDTETTGLLAPSINRLDAQPYIVEFYGIKIDDESFKPVAEFHQLIKPPIPIPPEVTKIHGIDDARVKASPPFAEIADGLAEFFFGVNTMVAHNLPYDRSMLANELLRCDKVLKFPWPTHHVCTVEESIYIEQRRLKLSELHTYAVGYPHLDAHHAKNDVFALVRCYHWLKEEKSRREAK